MAPIFPPRGGARGRSRQGLEPWVTAPGRAASRPIPRRKSFTNLSNLHAHRSPTRLETYLRQRWRGDGKEQNQPPSGSHLPQKQLPVHTPSTTVPHTVHTPRGIFRARAGDDVFINWTGGLGAKMPAPWQRETGRNQLRLQRLQRVPAPPWRVHSYGREGQGDTNCACSCVNEPSAASFATN